MEEIKKGFEAIETDYDIKKIYEKMEMDLIESMKRTLASHKQDEKLMGFDWPQWQSIKLKQLQNYRNNNKEMFKKYQEPIDQYVYKQIREQFKEGALKTNKSAIQAGLIKKDDAQLGETFFRINDRKVNALADSVVNNLQDATKATLRQANDVYRSTIYKASQMASHGAKTVNQAIDMATHDFLKRGFKTIEYKDGSLHDTSDYADMAVRTATKRANLMGEGEMRKKLGNPLVYISKHGGACDKCTPWEGRVYIDDVWSGGTEKDGKYPLLSKAIDGGLFHPRCQHGSSTYYEGINEEPEEVTEAIHNHDENDKYTQYLQQKQKQYERLATGSLYSENIEKYQSKAEELQNKIESSKIELSNEEKQQLTYYTGFDATIINKAIRLDRITDEIKRKIDVIDNAFKKARPLENDIILYRGTIIQSVSGFENINKVSVEEIMKLKNKIISDKAFISTSRVKAEESGRNIIMNIRVPKGFKNSLDIKEYSVEKYKYQEEVLLNRNTQFYVNNIKYIDNKYYFDMEVIE